MTHDHDQKQLSLIPPAVLLLFSPTDRTSKYKSTSSNCTKKRWLRISVFSSVFVLPCLWFMGKPAIIVFVCVKWLGQNQKTRSIIPSIMQQQSWMDLLIEMITSVPFLTLPSKLLWWALAVRQAQGDPMECWPTVAARHAKVTWESLGEQC